MGVWEQVMEFFGIGPRRPQPPPTSPEEHSRAGQVYETINRANCASDHADALGRSVLDQDRALTEAEVELLDGEWRRRAGGKPDR